MPLRPSSKIPALNAWQAFCAQMPTDEQFETWISAYPEGNIGLPLGPQSGIVVVDLDTEDPRVAKVLDALLPPTPWERVGKKGSVRAFRYNGERSYRIKDDEGKTLLEVLSRGTQVVLPPSIHPDTQRPYTANTNLWEVLDRLTALPPGFENDLRKGLVSAGIKLQSRGTTKVADWVPTGGRDNAMTSLAGLLARSVIRKERSVLEALNEMEMWVATYTERVEGDLLDPERCRKKVMEFLRRDVVEGKRPLPQGWDGGMNDEERAECLRYFGDDAQEWSQNDLLTYIREKFTEIPKEDVVGRGAVIDEVLLRMSRSETMTAIDKDVMLQYLVTASARTVHMAALRKRIIEIGQDGISGVDHSEIAKALISEMERYGEVRYEASRIYQWRGSHWEVVKDPDIYKLISKEFGSMPAAKKFNDHRGIYSTMINMLQHGLRETQVQGINLANGYLTKDLELLPHSPEYGATYCMPYRYLGGDAPAPLRFLALLDSCWGEDPDYADKVQALREAIAAVLFGEGTRFQRAICLQGVAHSGKSVISDIVQGLLPNGVVSVVAPHDWDDQFLPAMMYGKLLNFCGELSESRMIDGSKFKSIIEGAEIQGQEKHKPVFSFHPTCMQWFASNHLPRTRDTSSGFTRRWLFLQFNRPFPASERNTSLADEIIQEEREAIVAWAAPAIGDLYANQNYTLPASHREVMEEVATINNNVRFFLSTGVVKRGGQMTEVEVYGAYYAWCKVSSNSQPVGLKVFRQRMMELQSEFSFRIKAEGPAQVYEGLSK